MPTPAQQLGYVRVRRGCKSRGTPAARGGGGTGSNVSLRSQSEAEMASRYLGGIVCGLFIVGLLVFPTRAAVERKEKSDAVNLKMVAAAKEALKATQAIYDVGRADIEDVYRWSLRTVEADHFSPPSIAAHLTLMEDLHDRAAAKATVGAEGGEPHVVHATKYYVAEAEGLSGK
jgi:hypothetical protein